MLVSPFFSAFRPGLGVLYPSTRSPGMAALSHVGGCSEKHSEWSKTAVAFTKSWADAYESADSVVRAGLGVLESGSGEGGVLSCVMLVFWCDLGLFGLSSLSVLFALWFGVKWFSFLLR